MTLEDLIVFLMAAAPAVESRLAIPYGILVAQLDPWRVVFIAFVGSLLPTFAVTPFLFQFGEYLKKNVRQFRRILKRTQEKHNIRFEEGKLLALLILVALPVPVSGVWTGILVSYIFGIPQRFAIPVIIAGSLIGAVAVGILTSGIDTLIHAS